MLVGELSKRTGLTRDTIRFYEKHGLIAVGKKERRYNNYKEYSDETLRRLMSIRLIKSLGFTLNEVAEVLDMMDMRQATCDNMVEKFEDKVQRIDGRIRELLSMRAVLLHGLSKCKSSCCSPAEGENCGMVAGVNNL